VSGTVQNHTVFVDAQHVRRKEIALSDITIPVKIQII